MKNRKKNVVLTQERLHLCMCATFPFFCSLGCLERWAWVVTALQARTFAVWTLTSAIVRFYAAYHISDKTYVLELIFVHA